MLRNFSTSVRIFALLAIMVVFLAGTVGGFLNNASSIEKYSLDTIGDVMLKDQHDKIKVAVESLKLTLAAIASEATSEEDRNQRLQDVIKTIRFEDDKSGYFFVFKGTVTVAHISEKLLGRDMGATKDKNGKLFMQDIVATARRGGGFVDYVWPKPGAGDQPKIAYSTMIPGTDLVLGTGIYIDNIEASKAVVTENIDNMVSSSTTLILSLIGGLFLFLVVPASIAIIRSIVRPIRNATDAAQQISDGNLEVSLEVKGKDEAARLEQALNNMVTTLSANIEEINHKTEEAERKAEEAELATLEANKAKELAERAKSEGMHQAAERLESIVARVSSATEQMSSQAEQIRQGTEIQSERIATTATAMEEMNATVLEVARNSSETAHIGEESKDNAQQGAQVVDQAINAMQSTQEKTNELKDNMNQLGEKAEAIGAIMTVIEDIADQTNLLALNAAIEAARAGDAGRGFAVVADEVRKLAEKTMTATKEVGDSIRSIQNAAKDNMSAVDKAVDELGSAVDLANRSGEVLSEIVTGVENSANQIQSIATAAEQQSATSEEINQSVEEVNRITMETSRGVSETTEALRDLSSQMGELVNLIEELKAE